MKDVSYIIILSLLIIGYSNAQVVIPCNFNMTTARGYECRLPDVDLSQFESFIIGGDTHLGGMNDLMVESFFSIHNNFQYYPTIHLQRFPNLRHIKVSESLITEIPAGAITNRPLLETLSLSANRITQINPAAFTGTTNIRTLSLMFNQIRFLDNALYAMFPGIINLDLSFNIIERVHGNMFSNNPNMQTLSLNMNRAVFLNNTFFNNLVSLSTFQFESNICYGATFVGLQIPANRGEMFQRLIPCFIEGPSQFNCLFGFSFDGIEFDGDYTCLLRGIEAYDVTREINLAGWHLAGQNNNNVRFVWIHLSDTRFIINQMFIDFINLRGVQITGSNLQFLQEDAFRGGSNLQHLTITVNHVRRLEANTFRYAFNLQQIYFLGNDLEYVNEAAFAGLPNLQELALFGGRLTFLAPNVFAPLVNLRFFDASSNHLEIIDSRWFVNNSQIFQLNFNRNFIHSIHTSLVDMPMLTNLQLLENVCVDAMFLINDQTREQVRTQLNPCFENYPLRLQRFIIELEGDLGVYHGNGTLVINL